MSMIEVSRTGDDEARIGGWEAGNSIAVISWRGEGATQQQEVADEREAIRLLKSIGDDESLTLISAQLRRAGTGSAS
jgi:hypothetical protein